MSSGSAIISSSKRTDLCVPGVLTTSGVSFKDMEKKEDDGEADPDTDEAAIASVMVELTMRRVGCRVLQMHVTSKNLYMRHGSHSYACRAQLGRTRSMEDFAVPSNIVYAPWHDPAS